MSEALGGAESEQQHLLESQFQKDAKLLEAKRESMRRKQELNSKIWWKSFFTGNFCCNLGYRMESQRRTVSHVQTKLNPDAISGWAVGVRPLQLLSLGNNILDLVQPSVMIHAVDVDTGLYIHSLKHPISTPIHTRGCFLKDSSTVPSWNDDLVINASLIDILDPNTLLLFEILDNRTSLNLKKHEQNYESLKKPPKKIAWGYLLPVGSAGAIHVGLPNEFKHKEDPSEADIASRNRQQQRNAHRRRRNDTANGNDEEDEGPSHHKDGELEEDGSDLENYEADYSHIKQLSYDADKGAFDISRKLQLYAYVNYDGVVGSIQRAMMGWSDTVDETVDENGIAVKSTANTSTCEVYLQWRKHRRYELDGSVLHISIGPRHRVPSRLGVMVPTIALGALGGLGASPIHLLGTARRDEGNNAKIRAAVMKRTRGLREPCIVPDSLVHRLNVGPGGAMVVAFSTCGHLLAVASPAVVTSLPLPGATNLAAPYPGSMYSLRVFDPDTGVEAWSMHAAHHGIIYSLTWSKDDSCLLSTSADGTAKVWSMLALHPNIKKYVLQQEREEKEHEHEHEQDINNNSKSGEEHSSSPSKAAAGTSSSPTKGADDSNNNDTTNNVNASTNFSELRQFKAALYTLIPSLYSVYAHSPPAYVYCGAFQEFNQSPGLSQLSSTLPSNSNLNDTTVNATNRLFSSHPVLQYLNQQLNGLDPGEKELSLPDPALLQSLELPRIITGASDGRIRVWTGKHQLIGEITVNSESQSFPAHEGRVHSLVIDERSRYLFSGDNRGDVVIWRLDAKGWYQLLRKFKKDIQVNNAKANRNYIENKSEEMEKMEEVLSCGISSLTLHPDKTRSQLLALSHSPSPSLRVYSLSTYKPLSSCSGFKGFHSHGANTDTAISVPFCRAQFSADGKFAVCGVPISSNSSSAASMWRVRVWDSQTGQVVHNPLSDIVHSFPIRSMSWHPKQHLLAVAMLGTNAAVVVYAKERDSAEHAIQSAAVTALSQLANDLNSNATATVADPVNRSMEKAASSSPTRVRISTNPPTAAADSKPTASESAVIKPDVSVSPDAKSTSQHARSIVMSKLKGLKG